MGAMAEDILIQGVNEDVSGDTDWYEVSRRGFDVIGGLLLLALTSPLLLLVTFLIKLDSRGPVLYRQSRVGLHGRIFTILKFRSMRVGAETAGPCWATTGDPRVTRIGRFIRATRLDEVPQLLNVLRGEMSLVGPRPERPHFVRQLVAVIPRYNERTLVRPGITGWAQINYPYGASIEDARAKLEFDIFYINNRTLLLDLRILLKTIPVVLLRKGAR
jgi:exopolysaccharide biosynthesis polyprenyl glycosylphosphotransferase